MSAAKTRDANHPCPTIAAAPTVSVSAADKSKVLNFFMQIPPGFVCPLASDAQFHLSLPAYEARRAAASQALLDQASIE
jgi:hypothetical protein